MLRCSLTVFFRSRKWSLVIDKKSANLGKLECFSLKFHVFYSDFLNLKLMNFIKSLLNEPNFVVWISSNRKREVDVIFLTKFLCSSNLLSHRNDGHSHHPAMVHNGNNSKKLVLLPMNTMVIKSMFITKTQ